MPTLGTFLYASSKSGLAVRSHFTSCSTQSVSSASPRSIQPQRCCWSSLPCTNPQSTSLTHNPQRVLTPRRLYVQLDPQLPRQQVEIVLCALHFDGRPRSWGVHHPGHNRPPCRHSVLFELASK